MVTTAADVRADLLLSLQAEGPGGDACPAPRIAAAAPSLPTPRQLAALGVVLCLSRVRGDGELGGWSRAVRAVACGGVDSEGLRECLLFFDRDDRCCWRLQLLPDSDFLAWQALHVALPAAALPECGQGIGERLWSRLAGRLRGEQWRGTALRLHALPVAPGFASASAPVLAASLTALSPASVAAARRIVRELDAEHDAWVEDCCCRQAASATPGPATRDGDAVHPLIRLNLGEHA